MDFYKKQPCNNCPYRLDAPLQLWSIEEFRDLMKHDEQWGGIYGCHKKDGHVCVGWLMKQDEMRIPNLRMRMALSSANVTREYMDALNCKTGLYNTLEDMVQANFPELI